MRLKTYIISEGRSKEIDQDTFVTGVRENCKKSLDASKKDKNLYRGVRDFKKFIYIVPKNHVRVSANTNNMYTLVIDNDPKWKKYPKRSESIICSSSLSGAAGYGNLYQVFPKDGSNYGIVNAEDLWKGFNKTFGPYSLEFFNREVIFELADRKLNIVDARGFKTYKDLVEIFQKMDFLFKDRSMDPMDHVFAWPWIAKYDGDFLKLVRQLLDPTKNGFKHTKNPQDIPTDDKEVWTDGDTYMTTSMWVDKNRNLLYGD